MSDKIDLVYDLVTRIEERQRKKDLEDAARHASESSWRGYVNTKLEEHSAFHIKTEKRLDTLEESGKVWAWFQSRTGKIGAGVAGVISTAYAIYRMIG